MVAAMPVTGGVEEDGNGDEEEEGGPGSDINGVWIVAHLASRMLRAGRRP